MFDPKIDQEVNVFKFWLSVSLRELEKKGKDPLVIHKSGLGREILLHCKSKETLWRQKESFEFRRPVQEPPAKLTNQSSRTNRE